jgi:hypothetical protein
MNLHFHLIDESHSTDFHVEKTSLGGVPPGQNHNIVAGARVNSI